MKKIYHIKQKKSILEFTRGPPFMIFNQYKLKIIGGRSGSNRKVAKMLRNERS